MSGYTSVDLTRRMAVGDVCLAWDCWGPEDGPAFVLVHGFSGTACDFELHLDALLALGGRVVMLEQRGHGRSDRADPDSYSLAQLAEDLEDFLVQFGAGPVDLLGHSMGGYVVMQAALARPDLVRSLVLMDTSAWSFRSLDAEFAATFDSFLEAFDPNDGLPPLGLGGPEEVLAQASTSEAFLAARTKVQGLLDPQVFTQLLPEVLSSTLPDLSPRLSELQCPVTVLVGSNDEPYAGQADALAAAFPHGRLETIAGAYHSPQLTHQEQWLQVLARHLQNARP